MTALPPGAIDCDIHPAVPNLRALLPYLDAHWRDHVTTRGLDELNTIAYPVNAPLSARPVLTDWTEFGRRVTEVADATLREGVRLVYHHHMGTIVQSETDVHAFMAATGPSVHLLLDTGHATWGGADPAALAARYRDRISHVHTKDVRAAVRQRAADEDWSFLKSVVEGVYTVPGDGYIDFAAALRPVAASDYAGWLIVEAEQDPAKAHPLTYAKAGYTHLRKAAESVGFEIT